MSKSILLSGLAAIACVAGPVQAQQPPGVQSQQGVTTPGHAGPQAQPASRDAVSAADRDFINRAAQSGHAEVAAGKLAATRGSDPGLRDFGRQLVQDHQAANVQLVQIAHSAGVTPPTGPSAEQSASLRRLGQLSGDNFDRQFTQQMVDDHQKAIALFRDEAQGSGRNPALKTFARQTLPVLEQHLQRSQSLEASAGQQGGTRMGAAAAGAAANGQRLGRGANDRQSAASDAQQQVQEAVQVVHDMKSDLRATGLLDRARGVFILPDYARGALGIGAQGGKGILVTRNGNGFGNPAFYSMGGISIGPQAGASAGRVAFLLMSDRAVQQFRSGNKFSLDADAGLTIVNYSARRQASSGKMQDIVVWSGAKGAYVGASVGVTDVVADSEANRAYYGRPDATPPAILAGRIDNPHNNVLGRVLGV